MVGIAPPWSPEVKQAICVCAATVKVGEPANAVRNRATASIESADTMATAERERRQRKRGRPTQLRANEQSECAGSKQCDYAQGIASTRQSARGNRKITNANIRKCDKASADNNYDDGM